MAVRGQFANDLPVILFSASQVSSYRECARKWAWRYIAGFKTQPHVSAVLGTEVDDEQIQPYLRDGRAFDFSKPPIGKGFIASGYIAEAMRPYLPQPKTVEIQRYFVLPSPTKIEGESAFAFQGYMDIYADDSARYPGLAGGCPGVGDTKTTSDIGKWSKTKEKLNTDVQAMLYATSIMYETGARIVDLAWIYGQTKGAKKAKPVHLRVVADHVVEQFGKINATAVEMLAVRNGAPEGVDPIAAYVKTLEPNPDECESFGGCPHRDKCNLSPDQIITAHFAKARARGKEPTMTTNSTMSALDALKARKAAQQAGGSGATSGQPIAGGSATSSSAPVAAVATPAAAPPSSPAVQAPPAIEGVTFNETWTKASPTVDALFTKPVGINPPESALPPAPPVGSVEAAPAKKGRGPNKPKAELTTTLEVGITRSTALAMATLADEVSAALTKYAAAIGGAE
jgi:hypothetical protein